MPHTRSASKNLRKSEKRRLRNPTKKTIKTHIKRFLSAVAEGTPEKLREEFREAIRKLDKAAAKRVIHPNQAARRKSQLARVLNQKLATPPSPPQ